MEADSTTRLTEAQREVLRRWSERKSAKEIALELGITHWAVNERLRSARRVLRAATSDEACRMLAEAENGTYKQVVYKPHSVAQTTESPIIGTSDEDRARRAADRHSVREFQAAYTPGTRTWSGVSLPFPQPDGGPNGLSTRARLAWITIISFGIVIAVGTLITISSGLGHVVTAVLRAFT